MLVYVLLALGASLIANVFSNDPAVISTIRIFVWILPIGYGMQGIIILTNSSLNAMHRPMSALYLSAMRFFIFYVPLAYIGSLFFGLAGFFAGAVCGNFLMALISWRSFRSAIKVEHQLALDAA